MALSRRESLPKETKANFPHTNVGGFTVVSMSGWELNELTQPRLKLAVEQQLVDGKKGQSHGESSGGHPSHGGGGGDRDRSLPWWLWVSASYPLGSLVGVWQSAKR